MKTISLMSQLFDGNWTSADNIHIIRESPSANSKSVEALSANASSIQLTISTSRQAAIVYRIIFAVGETIVAGSGWQNNSAVYTPTGIEYDKIYITFRYDDWGQLPLSSITSCNITYDGTVKLPWSPDSAGFPTNNSFIEMPEKAMSQPYPRALWRIESGYNEGLPYNGLLTEAPYFGAFANATDLTVVRIPQSVKKIGRESFRGTQLRSVTIARDCEYYPTSFPDGCEVHFYTD